MNKKFSSHHHSLRSTKMLPPLADHLRLLCFLLLILLFHAPVLAAPSDYNEDAIRLVIDETKSMVKNKTTEFEELTKASERLGTTLTSVRQCVKSNKEELDKVSQSLEELGAKGVDESNEVSQQRKNFRTTKMNTQQDLTQCNVFVMQIDELLNTISERRQKLATLNILNKHDDLIALISAQPPGFREWWAEFSPFFNQQSGWEGLSFFVVILGGVLVSVIFFLSLWLRKFLLSEHANHHHPIVRALVNSLAHYLYLLFPVLTMGIFVQLLTSNRKSPTYLAPLAFTVCLYLLLRMLIRFFVKSTGGNEPLLPMPSHLTSPFERYLKWTALFLSLNIFLVSSEFFQKNDVPSFLLLRVTMLTLLCLLWIRLIWLFVNVPGREKSGKWLRLFLTPVLAAAMITGWLGYLNLSEYILTNTLKTIGGILLYFSTKYLLEGGFQSLSYGGSGWPARIRKKFGLEDQQVGTSFFWLHILLDLFALALLLLFIISSWSISQKFFSQTVNLLNEGFTIGHISIAPGRIFIGIFLFFLFWTLSLWAKNLIKEHLANNSHLTASARDATITVTGYLGFILALLAGCGASGMSFTSLTVIAGALSVGIGFGLQNIVNNFVSGLILIFERPIQRGDWIAVGPTEGYVTEISVRSTVIRTFDRADVIVPNSELISSQVTNWMYSDRKGRVKIPIGVAYGSDTEVVKKLLLEVAYSHPEVVTTETNLEPQVLFMEFAESSLNFELRCFIHEVDKRLICRSDLNFAIDKIFREHQIVIPFPQRDLNLKGEFISARANVDSTQAVKETTLGDSVSK
ncbi:MAG: mechanosensitive ion channel [Proteobacteria bacterium]|nr:mechanosensitive ion channel [Pseudomonadota bacterium]